MASAQERQTATGAPPRKPFAPPVPLAERLRFLRVQQDSAHTRLLPPGGPR